MIKAIRNAKHKRNTINKKESKNKHQLQEEKMLQIFIIKRALREVLAKRIIQIFYKEK